MILIYFCNGMRFDGASKTFPEGTGVGILGNHATRSLGTLADLSMSRCEVSEQFMVGSLRCWDAFMLTADPILPIRQLAPVFAYMNVLEALCAFEKAFCALHASPRRLAFKEADDERIGSDEARMLSAVASLQIGHSRAAVSVLRPRLSDAVVRNLVPPLARIAALLCQKGHQLPRWH